VADYPRPRPAAPLVFFEADSGVDVPRLAVDGHAQMHGSGMAALYRAVVAVVNELVARYHDLAFLGKHGKIKVVFFCHNASQSVLKYPIFVIPNSPAFKLKASQPKDYEA
jgi:hypothetical protein